MRPIKLTLQAFGPFVQKTTIPFENLGTSNIYLISGITGSGKTSIFDAICFALFNTSSGENRGNQTLRSHFADDSIESYVEFDFMFNNEKYSILRYPSYERKKSRGDGTIIQPSKVQITLPNGKIIEKQKEADIFITELLGVDINQFSQIALLAQGEFLKLLNSDTQTRGEIFRNIFKTWDFANFQNKLKEKTSEYKNKYQETQNSIIQYISTLISQEENLTALCEKYKENKCFDNLDKLISLLDIQNKEDNKKLKTIQKEIQRLETTIETSQKEFQTIQNKINLLNQKENLTAQKEKLDLEFKHIEKEYKNRIEINKEIQNTNFEIKKSQENYQKALKLKELHSAKEKIELDLNLKTEELKNIQNKIKDFKFLHLKKISNEYCLLEEEKIQKQELFIKIQQEIKKLTEEYNNSYNTYLETQAGILAKSLKNNTPCPVCGSITHPKKAKIKNENLTKEFIDKLKKELEKENEILLNISKECSILNEKSDFKSKEFEIKQKNYELNIEKTKYNISDINYEEEILLLTKLQNSINDEITSLNNEIISIISKIEAITDKKDLSDINSILDINENLNKKLQLLQNKLSETENNYNQKNIELNTVKSKIKLLDEQLNNIKETDISGIKNIEAKIEQYKFSIIDFNKQIEEIISRKSINEKNLENIIIKNKEYIKISALYKDYKILSDCANGNLKGQARIAFEQYIQGYYLDLVLYEANKRLKIMTQNQFQLFRKKDTSSHQSKIGLELEVMDFHTYKKRSTKTLSGGESFKAALALALGLSDCVSNFSGAINIDAMFIDEGFGSLDSESLELAMEVIFDLSDTNRLVGIISHIDDLKTKIPNQINTYKTQNGSILKTSF